MGTLKPQGKTLRDCGGPNTMVGRLRRGWTVGGDHHHWEQVVPTLKMPTFQWPSRQTCLLVALFKPLVPQGPNENQGPKSPSCGERWWVGEQRVSSVLALLQSGGLRDEGRERDHVWLRLSASIQAQR